MTTERSLAIVRGYYENAVATHPPSSPLAVDWASVEAQSSRLAVLLDATAAMSPGSVCDLGCGVGALLALIRSRGHRWLYTGVDVAPAMIERATRAVVDSAAEFVVGGEPTPADVVVASGIFNVRPGLSDEAWQGHVDATLIMMLRAATVGVVANFLPPPSAGWETEPHLYHESPARVSALFRDHGCDVSLITDYGPYDFTLVARKECAA